MRRYSFGTFLVDDANRALYDTCRSIASLSYRGRLPVLLVAPEGFGKTHLLYSIVNRARSGPARTGVAFVSADEFPTEVRRLTRNPGPVERARNAILLVDDLHRFKDQLDELDKLVDLFLKHGHYVVISSAVPLASLGHLPAPLLRRLGRGHAFQVEAGARLSPKQPSAQSVETAPSGLDAELDGLRRQCENAQHEMETARREIEQLRAENALLKVSAREVGPLRERLDMLQDRFDQSNDEPVKPPASPARQQAGVVLEKAAALLEEVQQSRTRLAQLRDQSRIFDLKPEPAAPAQPAPVETQEPVEPDATNHALAQVLAERDQLREEREKLERDVETLRRSVARANEERDETRRHLRAAFEKLDRYEKNLDELRAQVDQYSSEQETAVEERVQLQSEATRIDAAAVSEGLRDVQAQFAAGLRMIDRMADQLDALCVSLGASEVPDRLSGDAEPFFVTPAAEEAVPERNPEEDREDETAFVPGIGAHRESAVDAEPAQLRRLDADWAPRRSLHHIEELSEPGLFSYPDEYDSSI